MAHSAPRHSGNSVWADPRTEARLRELWTQGHSAARIGDMMGLSKNAVVGKAHRLNLVSRPSPILRSATGARKPKPIKRAPLTTLPALAAPPAPIVLMPVAAEPAGAPREPQPACCWPIGDPRSKAFRFCDESAEPGAPYCAAHCAKAYDKQTRVNHGALPW